MNLSIVVHAYILAEELGHQQAQCILKISNLLLRLLTKKPDGVLQNPNLTMLITLMAWHMCNTK